MVIVETRTQRSTEDIISAGMEPFFNFLDTLPDQKIFNMGDGEYCILHSYFLSYGLNHNIGLDGIYESENSCKYTHHFDPEHWMVKLQGTFPDYATVAEIRVEALLLGSN